MRRRVCRFFIAIACVVVFQGCQKAAQAPVKDTTEFTEKSYSDPDYLESQTRTAE